MEAVDQRLDLGGFLARRARCVWPWSATGPESVARPIRPGSPCRNAPDFLGVGLEEDLIQALAEAVADPLLQILFVVVIEQPRPQIAEDDADAFRLSPSPKSAFLGFSG